MLELAREIKSRGLKTAILSNMPFDLLAELRRKFDWLDEFDVQIWSCELGVIKPDAGNLSRVPDCAGLRAGARAVL